MGRRDYRANNFHGLHYGRGIYSVNGRLNRLVKYSGDDVWTVESRPLLGDKLLAKGEVDAEIMHGVVFLAWLANRHLGMSADTLLDDSGVVHRAVHRLVGDPNIEDTLIDLAHALNEIQRWIETHYQDGLGVDV